MKNNKQYGIDIRDPSQPNSFINNNVEQNNLQVKLDKNIKKNWQLYKDTNNINGESDVPKGFSCSIF